MDTIQLKSCKKGYVYDQDKAIPPEETVRTALEKLKQFEHPLFEKFYKVENDFDIPIYRLEISKYIPCAYPLFEGTWGKGVADAQAQASCIMEFVERYSATQYRSWFKEKHGNFEAGSALPMECWKNSLDYSGKDAKSLLDAARDMMIDWGKAYNLNTNRYEFVPKIFYDTCTTGLAAGNTMEEALLQGMCECVERHVSAHVYRHGGEYPTVDKATIENVLIRKLIKTIESQGIEITIKDFSSLTGVPALGIILIKGSTPGHIIGQRLGVCPDKEKGLMRALTENAQGSVISKMKHKLGGSDFFHHDRPEELAALMKGRKISFSAVTDIKKDDIKDEIDSFLQILNKKGFEPLFIDMTHPKIGIPAVWVYLKNAFLIFFYRSLPFTIARASIEAGEYCKGIEYLEKELAADTEKYVVYYNLGYCYYSLKEFDKAVSYYEKAHEEFFGSKKYLVDTQEDFLERIYSALGVCYLNLERYQKAKENFEKAKEHEQLDAETYMNLGLCYFKMGRYHDALESYNKGMELDPMTKADKLPNAELGMCCLELGDFAKAAGYFGEIIKLRPDDWMGYHFQGISYRGLGEYGKAAEAFKRSIELNAFEWSSYNLLGATYREQGEYAKAEAALKEAIRINPGEWRNYNVLGNTYKKKGAHGDAVTMFKKALEICDDTGYLNKIRDSMAEAESNINKR